jgi:hypothetical protein
MSNIEKLVTKLINLKLSPESHEVVFTVKDYNNGNGIYVEFSYDSWDLVDDEYKTRKFLSRVEHNLSSIISNYFKMQSTIVFNPYNYKELSKDSEIIYHIKEDIKIWNSRLLSYDNSITLKLKEISFDLSDRYEWWLNCLIYLDVYTNNNFSNNNLALNQYDMDISNILNDSSDIGYVSSFSDTNFRLNIIGDNN